MGMHRYNRCDGKQTDGVMERKSMSLLTVDFYCRFWTWRLPLWLVVARKWWESWNIYSVHKVLLKNHDPFRRLSLFLCRVNLFAAHLVLENLSRQSRRFDRAEYFDSKEKLITSIWFLEIRGNWVGIVKSHKWLLKENKWLHVVLDGVT